MTDSTPDQQIDRLRAQGFQGFDPLIGLPRATVPAGPGVHHVVRTVDADPVFLETSCAGSFKDRDPTVPVPDLERAWVPGAAVLYIGKANHVRRRLGEYARFGTGKRVGHWGGRYIFQLADAAELLVCWQTTDTDPRSIERQLISEFRAQHDGRALFANRVP